MKFGTIQRKMFGTAVGAYSIVTDRENYDSQITLTDYEAEIVLSHFGKNNIHVGNVKSNLTLSKKHFRLFPSGKPISLNLVFPKANKTELRLYISKAAGYKPKGDDVWFIFVKDGDIWIGSMPEQIWRYDSSMMKHDDSDEFYQRSVNDNDKIRIQKSKERDSYARDPRIAIRRMKMAGFKCEFDPAHQLFISRFSHQPYLEAHHLIPVGLQSDFKRSLDTVNNVFCLCPYCHRAVHHAEEKHARKILKALVEIRPVVLDSFSLTVNDLLSLYSVEVID
jgi:5-methylcytosine-specific restriction endonuclease McrA